MQRYISPNTELLLLNGESLMDLASDSIVKEPAPARLVGGDGRRVKVF